MSAINEAVPVGTLPSVGEVPARMFAQVVRQDRFGEPRDAFRVEEIDTPSPGPGEVLIAVMASGINFNNVWAARRIWGYDHDRNFGSFGQFAIAQEHQVLPKADHLTWEAAAAATLVGATAYRMLFGWQGNTVQKDDVVLVWGGSGGLGSQAIQLVKHAGGIPVAVVSSADKGEYCLRLGAAGFIDRTEFGHWGIPPHWTDGPGQKEWTTAARAFGGKIWEAVGERRSPAIVFEHPGEDTIPTSVFVCDAGGMVVICAGTSGYSAMVDLRYHWVRQK